MSETLKVELFRHPLILISFNDGQHGLLSNVEPFAALQSVPRESLPSYLVSRTKPLPPTPYTVLIEKKEVYWPPPLNMEELLAWKDKLRQHPLVQPHLLCVKHEPTIPPRTSVAGPRGAALRSNSARWLLATLSISVLNVSLLQTTVLRLTRTAVPRIPPTLNPHLVAPANATDEQCRKALSVELEPPPNVVGSRSQ